MENNITASYILELDPSGVKSAKNSIILMPFAQKIKKKTMVYSCCHGSHDASKVSLRSVLK